MAVGMLPQTVAAKAKAARGLASNPFAALAAETDFETQEQLVNAKTESKMRKKLGKSPEVLGLKLFCVTFACA